MNDCIMSDSMFKAAVNIALRGIAERIDTIDKKLDKVLEEIEKERNTKFVPHSDDYGNNTGETE